MPARLIRLLPAALLGASVAATAFAAQDTPLVWRGDVVTAHSVVDGMAKAWQRAGHGKMVVQPFNTASGLDAVGSGSADVAGSVRGSSGSAVDSQLTFTPVAWDGLVLVTSASNPVSSLTLKQLHDIYYGKITNWNQVGGPNAPIDVYAVASPGDGVEYSLRRLLFGRGNQPVAAPRLYLSTTSLEQGVVLDPHSLGATTLSSASGNRRLKMLRIDGSAPTQANVASGRYPLYTPIYLVTRAGSAHAAEAQSFVAFAGSAQGKAELRAHHLVPYADAGALASMDSPRRSRILAEVGAHAPVAMPSTPEAAPAAAVASRAVASATSHPPAAHPAAPQARLAAVHGSVIAKPEPTGLGHVRGEAITVAAAGSRGSDFAHVRSDSYVVYLHGHDGARRPAKASRLAAVHAPATPHHVATHKVAPGETLYSIARKHALDVAQIRRWNHLKNNIVRPGQILRLGAR